MAYKREGFVDVRIARIFNTFGPRMHPEDGRVVSNFIKQVLTATTYASAVILVFNGHGMSGSDEQGCAQY